MAKNDVYRIYYMKIPALDLIILAKLWAQNKWR